MLGFFTDRVRSTRREVIFSLCLSVHTWGGRVPRPGPDGEYPIQPWTGGGTPARSKWGWYAGEGVPWPGPDRGVPWGTPTSQGWGTLLSGPGWGYPGQVQTGGYPPSKAGWGTWQRVPHLNPQQGLPPPPGTGQQMEYLIRRGRYASCVHAGGLSCLKERIAK